MRPPDRSRYLPDSGPDPVDFLLQVVTDDAAGPDPRGETVGTPLEHGVDAWVAVHRVGTGRLDGEWQEGSAVAQCSGTRAEILAWMRTRDCAGRWLYDEGTQQFLSVH